MQTAPLWRPRATPSAHAPLEGDMAVDVAIIGAGITGLTLARHLLDAGVDVAVFELRSIGMGATAYSTGHLATALDVPWSKVRARFGPEGALEAAERSQEAIRTIEAFVEEYQISCGFRRANGWRYVEGADAQALEEERAAAHELGLDVDLVTPGPLPHITHALRFRGQAMFDPVAYLGGLAAGLTCPIFEDTLVDHVEHDHRCLLLARGHVVTASRVVYATHTPLGVELPLQARVAPYMSYVIGVTLDGPLPPDLYWDSDDPYHYVRPAAGPDGVEVLLIGGEDRKTGQEPNPEARFASLEAYARVRFPVREVMWRWCHEVFEPVDGLPYIGRLQPNVFAATGYAGNGLTFGTVAAREIADELLGKAGRTVFRPQRYKPLVSAQRFLKETGNIVWQLVRGRIEPVDAGLAEQVPAGDGRLLRVKDERVAVARTPGGHLYVLSPVCPHLGGVVHWNAAAGTWDCPLHGSRFDADGSVICGPASVGLTPSHTLPVGEERSITGVIQEYEAAGFTCALQVLEGGRIRCPSCDAEGPASSAQIETFQRFEGVSDPNDMCVVLATRLNRPDGTACRGVLVLGFGPLASPEDKEAFTKLNFAPGTRSPGP